MPAVVHNGGLIPAGDPFALGPLNIPAVGNEQARNAAVHTQVDLFQRLLTRAEGLLLIEMVTFGKHHRGHMETGIHAPENCLNQLGAFGQPITRRPGEFKVRADSGLSDHTLLIVSIWLPHEVTHRLKTHPLTAHIEHDSEAAGDAIRGGTGGEIHPVVAVLGRINLVIIPVQIKPRMLTVGAANVKFARYDALPRLLRGTHTFGVIHRDRPRRKSHSIGAVGHGSLGSCCARERLVGLCGWVRVRYRGLCARPAERNASLRGMPPRRPTPLRIPFATGKTLGAPHATQSAVRRAQ